MTAAEWRYFIPDDGETIDDARGIPVCEFDGGIHFADDAAEKARVHDHDDCDGYERGTDEIEIVVIAPDGARSHWMVEIEYRATAFATEKS